MNMKKIILNILFIVSVLLVFAGCNKNKEEIEKADLESVNNKIIEHFKKNNVLNYENFIFNYIDEENNVVVVGLLDNSSDEQAKFKKDVVDSNLIKFVKGNKLVNEKINIYEDENNKTEDLKSFIRTYNILNVADSNDENFLYLTIRAFNCEEVQTVIVKRELCPNIKVGKNYEFTIKPNFRMEDNILSIFNNSSILAIKETDKTGLEQIQDFIS